MRARCGIASRRRSKQRQQGAVEKRRTGEHEVIEDGDRTYDLVLPSPPLFHCSLLPLLRPSPASNTTPRAHSLIPARMHQFREHGKIGETRLVRWPAVTSALICRFLLDLACQQVRTQCAEREEYDSDARWHAVFPLIFYYASLTFREVWCSGCKHTETHYR
ncbi:unnamed protein product [Caenorhabditis auriculariae]|uniref:Uncharacterized protein n=1 Tax=Caenorhabditis auriculariae TaxID=2777116 RepID=A0A8S1HL06_9PELO|nr:unnamed protein product [Caenorhabditis auriculariae]